MDNITYSNALKVIHRNDVERVVQAVTRALNGNGSGKYNVVCRTVARQGAEEKWVNLIGKAYFDDHGKITLFGGIARNITELKNNESLRLVQKETEVTLLGAIELAKLGTWTLDLATGVYQYSERLRAWFGFDNDE